MVRSATAARLSLRATPQRPPGGEIAAELAAAAQARAASGQPARRFKDFQWATRDSWSRRRRVVAKAEHTKAGPNPRFVVTSLSVEEADARRLYEDIYCARGEMENRIKERQLDLFADRTSTATMRANQLRLWFASLAYVLVAALRRLGLRGTQLATATCGTIRGKLLNDASSPASIGCRATTMCLAEVAGNSQRQMPPPSVRSA